MARVAAVSKDIVEFGACGEDELPELIAALDREFVFGKGRRISLRSRFPAVFHRDKGTSILVARANAQVVSTLSFKYFDWVVGEQVWRGAMIGMVYTDAAWRGRGLASRLLDIAVKTFATECIDFAVLWTNKPEFYAQRGWVLTDSGYFGSVALAIPAAASEEAEVTQFSEESLEWMEALRQRWLSKRMVRDGLEYQKLPLPVESVGLVVNRMRGREGYMLLGKTGDTAFLYEMVGHPDSFPSLWSSLAHLGADAFINETCGSLANKWLRCHTRAIWQVQRQAMWRTLSEKAKAAPFAQWHIPYFDRI